MPTIKKQKPTKKKKKTVKSKDNPATTSGSLLSQATNLEDCFEDQGIKINLYGRSGTGKTTLWATFPKPILVLVCSGSAQPGELKSIDTKEYAKTIKTVTITSIEQIQGLASELAEGDHDYKTIVLDHASGLQDLCLIDLLGLAQAPVQMAWGTATQQQWGQIGIKMKQILRSLLDLPQNVVIVAQEREFNTDNDNDILMPYVASALSPSIVGWLNPAVDYICQTFLRTRMETKTIKLAGKTKTAKKATDDQEYCLRTGPDPVFTTKFRVPKQQVLPKILVDPDYAKIMTVINGK